MLPVSDPSMCCRHIHSFYGNESPLGVKRSGFKRFGNEPRVSLGYIIVLLWDQVNELIGLGDLSPEISSNSEVLEFADHLEVLKRTYYFRFLILKFE